MPLHGQVALVTGGSRGIGRGVASELARQGAKVFVTGRTESDLATIGEGTIGIRCDHTVDSDVEAAFARIAQEDAIDILVNNVWGGYERMVDNGEFTWMKPFWQQPLWRWDAMFGAGVRAHYQASQLAAPAWSLARRGLIVNISHWAAQKHLGNVAYGVSKAATDKMTARHGERAAATRRDRRVALPGNGAHGEGDGRGGVARPEQLRIPEFIGRAVAALAADPDVMRHTGKVLVAAALALDYGFTDIDGKTSASAHTRRRVH